MKALFIGGTGIISEASTALAAERGIDLHLLNRGKTGVPVPAGVKQIQADIHDRAAAIEALGDHVFDVVVNWIAFTPDHVGADVEMFRARTRQYIFISSAVVYQKPPQRWPITEDTPMRNPYSKYALDKIACEQTLMQAYRDYGFPVTIVRPSHTYGRTMVPNAIAGRDYTLIDRIRKGRKIVVHGDGQTLWTMTHNTDFAKGFVGLMGNVRAIGHAFHITSDEALTWDQIYTTIGRAAGAEPDILHVPSDFIARHWPETGAGLIGDKAYCAIFDNGKLKSFVPGFTATVSFAEGIRRTIEWFDADPARQIVNERVNEKIDQIVTAYSRALA